MQKSPKDKMVKASPRVKKPDPVKALVPTTSEMQLVREAIKKEDPFSHLTRGQIDLIKTQVAKGATDEELLLFISVCKSAELDPILKQVHLVKRWDSRTGTEVGAIQVGIDGFRSIAERSGQYAGSDDAVYRDEKPISITRKNGQKVDFTAPGQATVCVYKLLKGQRCAFTATARWSEYYPGDAQGFQWQRMPYLMLGKCAEALALRKAFPKQLSGLYAPEEMQNTTVPEEVKPDFFATAIKIIKATNDRKGLEAMIDKLATSDKYSDNEKTELIDAIGAKITDLEALGYLQKKTDAEEAERKEVIASFEAEEVKQVQNV